MKKLIGLISLVLFFGLSSVAMATYSIRDDATGGDCTQIGVWDSGTKTCTLTTDLNFGSEPQFAMVIDSDNLTFDGNGHRMTREPGAGAYGVFVSGKTGTTIKNLTVEYFSYGIHLEASSGNTLSRNTAFGNSYGIEIGANSTDNILTGNTVTGNGTGLTLWDSSGGNILSGNVASNNEFGILLYASNNIIVNNTVSNNSYGIYLYGSNYITVYNNNFIDNWLHVLQNFTDISTNIFNLDVPIGGNYWNNFDTPNEGCKDKNRDGFCDAPYYFTYGVDYLPWIERDGWLR